MQTEPARLRSLLWDFSVFYLNLPNIDQEVATLGLKEMTQSIMKKTLLLLPGITETRKAIFEFDKLIRSLYL